MAAKEGGQTSTQCEPPKLPAHIASNFDRCVEIRRIELLQAVQDVNGRLTQDWGSTIIEFDQWQGVFSTGWPVPDGTRLFTHEDDSPSCTPELAEYETRSRAPGPGMIVEAMDTDLLVGVMTTSKLVRSATAGGSSSGGGGSGSGEVLIVVVDKRVDTNLTPPAARSVTLHFNHELVTEATILPLGVSSSASQLNATFNAAQRTLTITVRHKAPFLCRFWMETDHMPRQGWGQTLDRKSVV